MSLPATQAQVTNINGQYDTPIGTSGRIDTNTGTLLGARQIGTQPVVVPPMPAAKTPVGATVVPPSGTVTDSTTGAASIPPPATDTSTPAPQSGYQKLLDQLGNFGSQLSTKAAVTSGLQDQEQLSQKTEQATQDYNAYNKAKLDQAQTIERMKTTNPNGVYGGAQDQQISDFTARSNANLANLAVQAQSSQGLLSAAQQTIKDKLDAQFQPINDQIDFLTKFAQLNQNDLSQSDQIKLQASIAQKSKDADSVQKVANDLHQAVLNNGGNPAVLAALDKVTQDYTAGKIDAATAQSEYYSAAGAYGSTKAATIGGGGTGGVPESPTYTLQAGDDPYTIAQANGTDMATLQKLNPQVSDWHNLPAGYKLNLPVPAGQLSTDPTINNYAQGILDGSITSIAQVPKQYKDQVVAALNNPGTNGYTALATNRFVRAANGIVNNYIALPQYQLTANGLPYLQRIDAAIQHPGSVSDQDLLDSITKLNTAGNAISDAQVKVVTDGKSLSDWASVLGNKVANGGVLSQNQRKQIQTLANSTYANYKTGYQPVYDQATSQLKASGIPQAFWTIPDLNKLNAAQTGDNNSPTAPLKSGSTGTLSSGLTFTIE